MTRLICSIALSAISICACSTASVADGSLGDSSDIAIRDAADATADSSPSDAVDAQRAADVSDAAVNSDAADVTDADTDGGWRLVWSDEFDGATGSPANTATWINEVGGGGWGNSELEYYTAGSANASQQSGNLVIRAEREGTSPHSCWYGPCQFTSARLVTRGRVEYRYGRFESRIRIPAGQGIWPAWWLLGNDIGSVSWPRCGEIDIMENIGREPARNHGSLHGPIVASDGGITGFNVTGSADADGGVALAADFHVYAVEWEPGVVRFYLDDRLYETRTAADLPARGQWVFDHPFFVLLNVAVGGTWPGSPDGTSTFPQEMLVDYVRIYQR